MKSIICHTLLPFLAALAACSQVQRESRPDTTGTDRTSAASAPTTGTPAKGGGAQSPPWNFMSLTTGGVDAFLQAHPTYDGRGVLVLVFDTGVDMSITGLQQTTTGAPKVIDVRDFAASNVIRFRRATVAGGASDRSATAPGVAAKLRHLESIDPQPVDGVWYIGAMDESRFRSSSVRDFDGDGESTSIFGGLLYRAADGWRVAFDANADSSMAGEKPVGTYRERRETFGFLKSGADGPAPLTVAADIDSTTTSAALIYDMDGHGTHVAGISTGYGISGEKGFNGIAPGAQVIACKISNDTAKDNTTTGSMKRAYLWAAHLADSLEARRIPVVVNMSFGIGSAYEGRADIERFIDTLLPSHPNLYVVTSAGNEGPGLSTVGIPAASTRVITVGALLPQGVGRDTYGAALGEDILWNFSSRGGEVDKPDVVAPGTAVSTITRFAFDARLSGTSMASPYTAGVTALLLSALRQEDSTWMPTQALVRRALRASARPLAGYAAIEQGGGVVNVGRAYELLRRYRRSGFAADLEEYTVSTFSPNYPDERGTAAFWRSGYVPGDDWRQSFTINRMVRPDAKPDFFRAYALESTAPWLKPVQGVVYIRGTSSTEVDVTYDRDQMKEPGVYSARVVARRASADGAAAPEDVEFELTNTIVVPYRLSQERNYSVTTPSYRVAAGGYRRFFFAPPPGAASLSFTLSVPKGSRSNVAGWIIDRNGYTVNYLPRVKGAERSEGTNTVALSELGSGVIEVVVQAESMEGRGDSSEFALSASAQMLGLTADVETVAGTQRLDVEAVNNGNEPFDADISYTIRGYGRTIHDTLRSDLLTRPVRMQKEDGAVWLTVRFSPESYMRSTDILSRIVDGKGFVQAEESFNRPEVKLFLPNFDRDTASYDLQIIFGAANFEHQSGIPVEIVEEHVRSTDSRTLGSLGAEMIPYVPRRFSAKLQSQMTIPAGYHGLGEITVKQRGKETGVTFPFTFPSAASDAQARP